LNPTELHIRTERADHPQVGPLLAALDAYLAGLYAPEDNHILDVSALLMPDVHFLVAVQGQGEAECFVGCGAMRRMPGEATTGGQAFGEVKRMFVQPAARGHRIAERLLAELEAQLLRDGLSLATLETGRDQTEAVRLYERCGYTRRAPFAGYPDNGLSVFYEKRLA
jgi:putative acetyltransferase